MRLEKIGGQPPVISITGGTGFVGSHLLDRLKGLGATVRVLCRSAAPSPDDGFERYAGNLFDRGSLDGFLDGADLLVNLAQPPEPVSDIVYCEAIENIASAAVGAGVKRVLHLSTAMVIGVPADSRVDERSQCRPVTPYERQKHAAEQLLLGTFADQVDIGILRPTAVFGPGGRNLLKLCDTIGSGAPLRRRLLRLFHGRRHMHLVSVEDVVEAIIFLALGERQLDGNVFIVSSDHEPNNNYQAVDAILGRALGRPLPTRSASLPRWILRNTLRLLGRSQTDPCLVYDASKIRSWGFRQTTEFGTALERFAAAFSQPKGAR